MSGPGLGRPKAGESGQRMSSEEYRDNTDRIDLPLDVRKE